MKAILTGAVIILVLSVASVAVINGFDFSASGTFQSENNTVRLD